MSILPFLSSGDWWNRYDYPARLLDQHFGMGLLDSDLLAPTMYRGFVLRPRTQNNMDRSGMSEVVNDKNLFKVMLNVKHFKPEEISVKTVDQSVMVHCKHEEKSDEHGFVTREFTRRYALPEGTDPDTIRSQLSPNGVLIIEAPKVQQLESVQERVVPITLEKPAVQNS